jgi:hypothetical protein
MQDVGQRDDFRHALDLLGQFLDYCLMRLKHLDFGIGRCTGAQPD